MASERTNAREGVARRACRSIGSEDARGARRVTARGSIEVRRTRASTPLACLVSRNRDVTENAYENPNEGVGASETSNTRASGDDRLEISIPAAQCFFIEDIDESQTENARVERESRDANTPPFFFGLPGNTPIERTFFGRSSAAERVIRNARDTRVRSLHFVELHVTRRNSSEALA